MATWALAVDAMRQGKHVVRASQSAPPGNPLNGTFIGVGVEPVRLVAAWTDDQTPTIVFQGAWSKCMFAPEVEDEQANDWCESPF